MHETNQFVIISMCNDDSTELQIVSYQLLEEAG